MCEITAVTSKDARKYWLKCSVNGQRHPPASQESATHRDLDEQHPPSPG